MVNLIKETFGANEFGFDVGVHGINVAQNRWSGSEV
jgi:hypothetical protein